MSSRINRALSDIGYGVLLLGGSIVIAIILLILADALKWPIYLLYGLHPINQGLSDHIAFGSTVLFIVVSALWMCAFLVPRLRRRIYKTPWFIAGFLGIAFGMLALFDMRFNTDYQLYLNTGIVIILQGIVIAVGFLLHWRIVPSVTSK